MKSHHFSTLLFVVFMLCFTTIANAQIHLNVGAGANISKFDVKNISDFKQEYVNNYFISARPELRSGDFLSFSCDVQYSVKGSSLESNNPQSNLKTKLGYVDIIPQVGLNFLSFIEVYAGIGIGINTSESFKKENEGYMKPLVSTYKNDMSAVVGARFKVSKFMFHGHFSNSLKSINDFTIIDTNGNITDYKAYLRNIQVGISYQIF